MILSLNLIQSHFAVFSEAVTITLLHSIWQISLIGLVAFLIKSSISYRNFRVQYIISYLALLASGMLFLFGLMSRYYSVNAGNISTQLTSSGVENGTVLWTGATWGNYLNLLMEPLSRHQNVIFVLWLLGFLFCIGRIFYAYHRMNLIRRRSNPIVGTDLIELAKSLAKRLGIKKPVGLRTSNQVLTVLVSGWLKPIILLPVSVVNQLSAAEVEMVLAHELAHIKRNDWIFYCIQNALESFLYYHPVIWWLSGRINQERELCTDKLAMNVTGNKMALANALIKLQENQLKPIYTLAFSGSKNAFKHRVLSILDSSYRVHHGRPNYLGVVMILSLMALFPLGECLVETDVDSVKNEFEIEFESDRSELVELNETIALEYHEEHEAFSELQVEKKHEEKLIEARLNSGSSAKPAEQSTTMVFKSEGELTAKKTERFKEITPISGLTNKEIGIVQSEVKRFPLKKHIHHVRSSARAGEEDIFVLEMENSQGYQLFDSLHVEMFDPQNYDLDIKITDGSQVQIIEIVDGKSTTLFWDTEKDADLTVDIKDILESRGIRIDEISSRGSNTLLRKKIKVIKK